MRQKDVTVKAKISTGGEAIGDGFVTVTYDKAALEFVSGTNATGGDGTVKLEATGDGTVSELEYTMVFKALKEGATKLEVTEHRQRAQQGPLRWPQEREV